jgi:predicted phosphodiesterase
MARIAVISDIHANLTALDAVIDDLRTVAPDIVIQGGDVVGGGPRPAAVIDRLRDLNWPGVYGNTDEMLWAPEAMVEALKAPALASVRQTLATDTIPRTIADIGAARLTWLKSLPLCHSVGDVSVVHATPLSVWPVVPATASDDDLERTFSTLDSPLVVYGHIHHPYVRRLTGFTVVNAGAVGLSLDGDNRASYAVIDDARVSIRRVAYDVEAEIALLMAADDPFKSSTIQTLRSGRQ